MFEHFLELQDRILAIASRAEALLRSDTKDVATLGQGRWEVARALLEYQMFKHSRIFDPIDRAQNGRAARARGMKAECLRFGDELRAYVLKWSSLSVVDHWEQYKPAALEGIARMRAHLARERAEIAELLEIKSAA